MNSSESGIDCESPYFSKIYNQVESPVLDFVGTMAYSYDTEHLIFFNDRISFVNVNAFTSDYKFKQMNQLDSLEISSRLLQEDSPKEYQDEQDLGTPIENVLEKYDPIEINYNENFLKEKEKINMKNLRIFHIVKDFDNPQTDPLNMHLFMFENKGILMNLKNTINQFVDIQIKEHQLNEMVVSKLKIF